MDKTVHTFEHNDVPVSHVPVNICLLYHDSLCNIRWGKISPEPGGAGRMGGMAEMAGRVSRDGQAGGITRMVSVQWEMEPCIIECAQGGGTKKGSPDTKGFPDKKIEQVMGIEPTYLAWKASVLPLNYTCVMTASLCGQCPKSESNQRHEDFQSSALPTELSGHLSMGTIRNHQ